MHPTDKLTGLTVEDVRDILSYNAETGIFRARIGRSHCRAGAIAGFQRPDGYIQIKFGARAYLAHRLAWFYITGDWPSEIDHINQDKGDNRFSNLRQVTRSQNCINTTRTNNTSGVTGVHFDRRKGLWVAYMRFNGHRKTLKRSKSKEVVIAVRKAAELKALSE